MDTVYYHLNVRRTKVSGGADLVTFVPTAAPTASGSRGEVLDFARCRQRLETKAAWQELTQAAEERMEAPVRSEPSQAFSASRRQGRLVWLDVCASVSVIAVSLAAVIAFFRLV